MTMTMMMKIDLVVHADSDWEVDHIVVGVSEGLQNVFFWRQKEEICFVQLYQTPLFSPFYFFLAWIHQKGDLKEQW